MGTYPVKGSPFYHYTFTHENRRYTGSTRLKGKKAADAELERIKQEILSGDAGKRKYTLVEAFNEWEEKHAMFMASYASTKSHVDHLLNHFGQDTLLHEVSQPELAGYVASCRVTPYRKKVYNYNSNSMVEVGNPRIASPATINRRIATFQGMHGKLSKWGARVAEIDFDGLKLKERTVVNNVLGRADPAILWEAAPTHLRHFIMVSLFTGWRKQNVLQLKGSQLDMDALVATTIGKGGKFITTPISKSFARYIRLYKLDEMDCVCAQWFPRLERYKPVKDIKTAWNSLFERTGIKRIRIHDLRHTFGTWLYEQTGDQRLVQDLLHHSDIKTSQRYTHTRQDMQREKLDKMSITVGIPKSKKRGS